jgi:hypothetical protein
LAWCDGERREGFEWESWVAGGESGDKLCGQGEDLVEVERGVEGFWEGGFFEGCADVGRVAGFDSQDGAGDGEVRAVDDLGGGTWEELEEEYDREGGRITKVSRDTNTLED